MSVSQDQISFQKDWTVSVLSGKRGLYHSKGPLSYLRGQSCSGKDTIHTASQHSTSMAHGLQSAADTAGF